VIGDSGRAEEIEGEGLDEYAERRNIQLVNDGRRNPMAKKSIEDYRAEVTDLKQQIRDLEDENQTLNDKLDNIADVLEPEEVGEEEADDDDDEMDRD
jgi:predicted RNase H-like nuclease (RuvC/YqgF family)